jgi:hypothetical protein
LRAALPRLLQRGTTRTLGRTIWAIAGLLCVAAVLGVLAATTLTCVVGLSAGTDTWCGALIPFVGAPIAIVCAVVVGFPAHLLFRKFGLSSWWHYVSGGVLIAVPVWYQLATPFSSPRWEHAGVFDSLNYLGSGLFAGLAFYLLLRWQRLNSTSNDAGAP